jgi:alpha-L-rhamnosidase
MILSIRPRQILIVMLVLLQSESSAQLLPTELSIENQHGHVITDRDKPLLGWNFYTAQRNKSQSAYEIIVSKLLSTVQKGSGDTWTSGKVVSSENVNIQFDGKTLESFQTYYWAVRTWDEAGQQSEWSKPASFETSFLRDGTWKAQWISDNSSSPQKDEDAFKTDRMPLLRKEFKEASKIESARLYISGLGYYEVHINGRKIGTQVLNPGWTNYEKTVLYSVHDVTAEISQGRNVIGAMLGNGWWNPLPIKLFGRWDLRNYLQTGRPCLIAELHLKYSDGTKKIIVTDDTWISAPGPVMRNNVYLGEHYDARYEQSNWDKAGVLSKEWSQARVVSGPSGKLSLQVQPPIRITRVIRPLNVKMVRPDTFIIDMGQNFAGVAKLRVKGKAGTKVTIRSGENIFKDGTLNYHTTVMTQIRKGGISGGPGAPANAWQEDSYTLKGGGVEEWAPRFTFHGFRYVEITGWPGVPTVNDIEGLRMNSDLEQTGSFQCSDQLLNKVQAAIDWTFKSNLFSVQSDCPAREKLGYGADMVVTANAFIYNYDMLHFYRKAVRDFADEQLADGGITETAPFVGIADRGYGGDSGPLGWQLAFPFLQKQLYDFYGDKRIIAENFDALKKQIDFLEKHAFEGLYYWDIGDHETLDPKAESFSASCFYYHHVVLASEFAGILQRKDDSLRFENLATNIKRSIIKKYLVPNTGRFDNGTQSAQIFALWYHLSPEKDLTIEKLMDEFMRHRYHVSGGIYATKMMFDVLREIERNDVAYKIASQGDFPGWGHMVNSGATTLWESWAFPEKYASQNHPMFGSVSEWFFCSVLGINPVAPGFKKIKIKPQPAGNLIWAKGTYKTVRGEVGCSWKLGKNSFELDVSVPSNTTAEVWIPAEKGSSISEGGKALGEKLIKVITTLDKFIVVEVGGGQYQFRVAN